MLTCAWMSEVRLSPPLGCWHGALSLTCEETARTVADQRGSSAEHISVAALCGLGGYLLYRHVNGSLPPVQDVLDRVRSSLDDLLDLVAFGGCSQTDQAYGVAGPSNIETVSSPATDLPNPDVPPIELTEGWANPVQLDSCGRTASTSCDSSPQRASTGLLGHDVIIDQPGSSALAFQRQADGMSIWTMPLRSEGKSESPESCADIFANNESPPPTRRRLLPSRVRIYDAASSNRSDRSARGGFDAASMISDRSFVLAQKLLVTEDVTSGGEDSAREMSPAVMARLESQGLLDLLSDSDIEISPKISTEPVDTAQYDRMEADASSVLNEALTLSADVEMLRRRAGLMQDPRQFYCSVLVPDTTDSEFSDHEILVTPHPFTPLHQVLPLSDSYCTQISLDLHSSASLRSSKSPERLPPTSEITREQTIMSDSVISAESMLSSCSAASRVLRHSALNTTQQKYDPPGSPSRNVNRVLPIERVIPAAVLSRSNLSATYKRAYLPHSNLNAIQAILIVVASELRRPIFKCSQFSTVTEALDFALVKHDCLRNLRIPSETQIVGQHDVRTKFVSCLSDLWKLDVRQSDSTVRKVLLDDLACGKNPTTVRLTVGVRLLLALRLIDIYATLTHDRQPAKHSHADLFRGRSLERLMAGLENDQVLSLWLLGDVLDIRIETFPAKMTSSGRRSTAWKLGLVDLADQNRGCDNDFAVILQ